MYTHKLLRLGKFRFLSVIIFKLGGNFVLNYAACLLMAVQEAMWLPHTFFQSKPEDGKLSERVHFENCS